MDKCIDSFFSISSPQEEGLLQVSKWLKLQVLLDEEEMRLLLNDLGQIYFVNVTGPVQKEQAILSKEQFFVFYKEYIDSLKKVVVPNFHNIRIPFSSSLSHDLDAFYAIALKDERYLIKPRKPVIQLQAHSFFYSQVDQSFHSMTLSPESISWGLQFSYPQWIQHPKNHQIQKIKDNPEWTNTSLFALLMKWMREFTRPTPFFVNGSKINVPIRIGKKALSWIKNHPQLKEKKIEIADAY